MQKQMIHNYLPLLFPAEPIAPPSRPTLDALHTLAVLPWPVITESVTVLPVKAVVVVALLLVVESLATLSVVVRVVVVVAMVVRVTVVTVRKLVLQRRGSIEKRLVGPVLANSRRGETKQRQDLLPVERQLPEQYSFTRRVGEA